MHMKRIIPCLDVREGRVVKGVDEVSIPFTIGGGLSSEEDVRMVLTAGAEGAPAAG